MSVLLFLGQAVQGYAMPSQPGYPGGPPQYGPGPGQPTGKCRSDITHGGPVMFNATG